MIIYYIDTENKMYVEPLDMTGLTEYEMPCYNGKPLPQHKNIDDVVLDNGEYYKYYNDDGTPDTGAITEDTIETEKQIQDSMIEEGNKVGIVNSDRVTVGANPIIEDEAVYNAWMKDLYDNKDAEPVQPTLYKPPEAERQMLAIYDEDEDEYTFTRYSDQWGWRWYLEVFRPDVNALAIAIYDAQGNYLYTTGGLIDTGNGSWYTTCPAGQATATQQDVYYKWLLGSANISDLEVYSGGVQTKSGTVHSDPRYD